ncbi:MAG: T9SS type A sorting domain-containing protein, partial [Saprospiraceae bacterium]
NVVNIQRENAPGDISVYPNPVKNTLNVDFELEQDEVVVLKITDMAGKTIFLEEYAAERGINNYTMNFGSLANSVYFVTMKSSNGMVTKRVVKQQ